MTLHCGLTSFESLKGMRCSAVSSETFSRDTQVSGHDCCYLWAVEKNGKSHSNRPDTIERPFLKVMELSPHKMSKSTASGKQSPASQPQLRHRYRHDNVNVLLLMQ